MSGGSYDYRYSTVEDTYGDKMYDLELNELIKDLVPLLKSLEWWQSSDTSEESYRKDVKQFKEKWFKQSQNNRLEKLIIEECEKLKQELLKTL